MVKNALQAQLLKAGLVDNKKAKKLSKQAVHEQRTGQSSDAEIKAKIEQDLQQKIAKDQSLNLKKIYINQQIYNALVSGSLVIAKDHSSYAILPKALADRINEKLTGFIIVNNSENTQAVTDEEDPYAAYVIPDDLMW